MRRCNCGHTRAGTSLASAAVLRAAPAGGVAVAAARGIRAVILGHQDEIVRQISKVLDELGVTHGIIAAGYDETVNLPVQIASVAILSGGAGL